MTKKLKIPRVGDILVFDITGERVQVVEVKKDMLTLEGNHGPWDEMIPYRAYNPHIVIPLEESRRKELIKKLLTE